MYEHFMYMFLAILITQEISTFSKEFFKYHNFLVNN